MYNCDIQSFHTKYSSCLNRLGRDEMIRSLFYICGATASPRALGCKCKSTPNFPCCAVLPPQQTPKNKTNRCMPLGSDTISSTDYLTSDVPGINILGEYCFVCVTIRDLSSEFIFR